MLYQFLSNNREELIERCTEKVAKRPKRNASSRQLHNGIPMFLEQLTRTLELEQAGDRTDALRISGISGGGGSAVTEMEVSAVAHGKKLLELDYTVDQVVHDYGDLCQAITDLAFERDAPFSVDEFRTLNRCLDNAIADAVTEFSFQREAALAKRQSANMNERLGSLVHELRNSLASATLAVEAIEMGNLSVSGATGAVLKRSLDWMGKLIDRSLSEVRLKGSPSEAHNIFSLAAFIEEAAVAARLDAQAHGCPFTVAKVDPLLSIAANRDLLLAALANLLHNAFKYTRYHTEVSLNAYSLGDRILIDVKDHCGGLQPGDAEKMFSSFTQGSHDKTGLGLGLSIARQSVTEQGGTLTVKDEPGVGCTFTISLPRPAITLLRALT